MIDLRGKSVHISVADAAMNTALKAAARRHGAAVVDQRVNARLLIVDDVGAPGQKALWNAVLLGATVASTSRLLSAGRAGPFLEYKAAVGIRRWIWMIDDIKARHPAIGQIVAAAAASRPSLWRLLITRNDFVAKSSVSASLQYVMGIVSTREKKQAGCHMPKRLVEKSECCTLDVGVVCHGVSLCVGGVCVVCACVC